MAVRFDAATEEYSATNGLPGNVYTVCCWVRPATLTAGNHVVYWLTASGDVFTGIEFRDSMNDLQAYDSSSYAFNGLGPLAASAGTWYRCALVINGASATFYRSAAGSALGSASVSDFTTPASPSTWYFGDDPYDEWLDGRLAAVKVWSAALTQAEVEHELAQYAPKRTAGLIRFHPFVKAETTDYSGAGNALSGGTGTSTEDGPPIPWRITTPRLIVPAAGALSATLGQPTETDTAQALARLKARTLGQPSETDTAQPVTRGHSRTLGQPTETDTSQAVGRAKTRALGQPAESDTAQPVTRAKARALGQPTETDTARVITASGALQIGQPAETDLARPVTRLHVITLGQPVETALARPVSRAKTTVLGQPAESDTALTVTGIGGASSGLAGRIVGLPSSVGSVVQPVTRSLVGSIE